MKKIFFAVIYIAAFAVTIINMVYSVRGSVFSDIADLPSGNYLKTTPSPDNISEIVTYKVENSVGEAVRCELKRKGKTRNVFWQTGTGNVDVIWQDNRIVMINGVELDVVGGGFYDCRRGVSLFQDGSIEGDEAAADEKSGNE